MTQQATALARVEAAVRREVDDSIRAYATELVLRDVEMDIADHALQTFTADAERILEVALQEAQRLVADRLREDVRSEGVPDRFPGTRSPREACPGTQTPADTQPHATR